MATRKKAAAPKSKKPDVDGDTPTILTRETRGLLVTISDEEWRQASEDLGSAHGEQAEHSERAKQIKDDLKACEGEITARIHKLARLVRNRSETRPVECELRAHRDLGEGLTVRTDTNEIIARRALTAQEKQLPLIKTEPGPSLAGEARSSVAGRNVEPYARGQADRAGIGADEPKPPCPYQGETSTGKLDAQRWEAGFEANADPLDGWEAPLELMEKAWEHGRMGRDLGVAKRGAPTELLEDLPTQSAIEVSWNEGNDAKGTAVKNPYRVDGVGGA